MKRILLYFYKGTGGGKENFIILLKNILINYKDLHIYVLTKDVKDYVLFEEFSNFTLLKINKSGFLSRILIQTFLIKKLIKDLKIDILWSVNFGSLLKISIPEIITLNNGYQVCSYKYLKYHPKHIFYLILLRFISNISMFFSNCIVVQSEDMFNNVRSNPFSKKKDVYIISKPCNFDNCVENIENIDPNPTINKSEKFTFLYAAAFYPHKNHKTIIMALYKLVKDNYNVRLILTINRKEANKIVDKDILEYLIKKKSLILYGWCNKLILKHLYNICDACLIPSIYESQTSAHLEALLFKKPMISAKEKYAYDACKNSSLYASVFDSNDWSRKMIQLINNEKLRKKLIDNGLKQKENYPKDWTEVSFMYYNIFKNLLK